MSLPDGPWVKERGVLYASLFTCFSGYTHGWLDRRLMDSAPLFPCSEKASAALPEITPVYVLLTSSRE